MLITGSAVFIVMGLIGGVAVILRKKLESDPLGTPALTRALGEILTQSTVLPGPHVEALKTEILRSSQSTTRLAAKLTEENRIIICARCASGVEADRAFVEVLKGCLDGGLTHLLMETTDNFHSSEQTMDDIERYLSRSINEVDDAKLLKNLSGVLGFTYQIEMLKAAKSYISEGNRNFHASELCDRSESARGRGDVYRIADSVLHDQILRVVLEPTAKALCVLTAVRAGSAGRKTTTTELLVEEGHSVVNILPCIVGIGGVASLGLESGKSLLVPARGNQILEACLKALRSPQFVARNKGEPLMEWDYWLIMI